MRRLVLVVLFAATVSVVMGFPALSQQVQPPETLVLKNGAEVSASRLIVTYRKGASQEEKDSVRAATGTVLDKALPEINAEVLRVEARHAEDLKAKRNRLEAQPPVLYVDYDHVMYPDWIPNDPKMVDDGNPDQDNLYAVRAPAAWDLNRSSGVEVALLDSGCWKFHEDLSGRVSAEYDFVNDAPVAEDVRGHGTLVSSIMAAATDNGLGIAGGVPDASILCAKVITDDNQVYVVDVLEALDWVETNGAKVVNMSFGAPSTAYNRALKTRIGTLNDSMVFVASAGNTGRSDPARYPAAYKGVEAVAATNEAGSQRWMEYDDSGTVIMGSTKGSFVDMAAPGDGVWAATNAKSSITSGCESDYIVDSYCTAHGTSMAAPHVAAAVALNMSAHPNRATSRVREDLHRGAIDLGARGKDSAFGHGLVDFRATLSSR